MNVKEMRFQTGLSQSKFAALFEIPIATLKDWEQGRRKPPKYVVNMMRIILESKGLIVSSVYIEACEKRRKNVEKALAIVLTATSGPNALFMDVLEAYIEGKISLEEIEARIDRLEYLGG